MGRVLRPLGRTILPLLLTFLAGCSHPAAVQTGADGGPPSPFRQDGDPPSGISSSPETGSESGVPFQDVQSLPVGTLLTVRLRDAITSDAPASNATFVALVDEPIVVEGATVVPRGASVAGRIEAARSSTTRRNHGYFRLTLDQVDIAGRELPIHTSSLVARGSVVDPPAGKLPDAVSLEQGRRLTFRLAEAVNVAGQPLSSQSAGQFPGQTSGPSSGPPSYPSPGQPSGTPR